MSRATPPIPLLPKKTSRETIQDLFRELSSLDEPALQDRVRTQKTHLPFLKLRTLAEYAEQRVDGLPDFAFAARIYRLLISERCASQLQYGIRANLAEENAKKQAEAIAKEEAEARVKEEEANEIAKAKAIVSIRQNTPYEYVVTPPCATPSHQQPTRPRNLTPAFFSRVHQPPEPPQTQKVIRRQKQHKKLEGNLSFLASHHDVDPTESNWDSMRATLSPHTQEILRNLW